jgi:hypothetical protein
MRSTHIVTCEGPPLDYTTRANLHRAGIALVAERPELRLEVEAASSAEALGLVRGVLADRPYDGFAIVTATSAA